MAKTKKVAVIIAVYNGEKHLTECLDSVKAQTYKDINIYVADDGSSDGTADILRDYKGIKVKYGRTNKGAATRYNELAGQAIADGCDFIQIMSADDIMQPNMAEKMVGAYKPGVGFVTPSLEFFGDNKGVHITSEDITYKSQLERNQVVGHMLIPADVWEALGGFDDETYTRFTRSSFEDYDLATRILKDFSYTTVSEPVIRYRTHAKQSSKEMQSVIDKLRTAFASKFKEYKGLEKLSKDGNDSSKQLQQTPVHKKKSGKSKKSNR